MTLRTRSLVAEPLRAEDYPFVLQMNQDPRVMRHLGGVRSEERTRKYMDDMLAQRAQRGYGVWMAREAATGALVGRASIHWREADGVVDNDLGYSIQPEHWGKGYATEIAEAIVAHAFGDLGFDHLMAFTATTNAASRRVLEKLRFAFVKDFVYANEPHLLFRRDR